MKYFALLALLSAASCVRADGCGGGSSAQAYRFGAVYTADLLANVEGGIRRGSAYLDNLDVTLTADGDAAFGWPNTCLFAYGLYNNGSRFSDGIAGDAQYLSNIETDVRAARLFEAWIDWRDPSNGLSLRTGLYDLNTEFDRVGAAGLFLNSAQGIDTAFGQSGRNGPSIFPVTSLAMRGQLEIKDYWIVRGALLDAVPGDPQHPARTTVKLGQGALTVIETDFGRDERRAGLGYWRYTDRFTDLDSGAMRTGNDGWYGFAETPFPGTPSVAVFVRLGRADERFNQFREFIGAGVVYRGAITGSDDDALGIAFAWAQTGRPWRGAFMSRAGELDFELTWLVQLSKSVSIQPDMQYVVNPGADPALGNALVVGIRGSIALAQ